MRNTEEFSREFIVNKHIQKYILTDGVAEKGVKSQFVEELDVVK